MESVQKVALLVGWSNSSIIIKWRRVEITAAWSSKHGTDHCFKGLDNTAKEPSSSRGVVIHNKNYISNL